jgi:hypothetical protein
MTNPWQYRKWTSTADLQARDIPLALAVVFLSMLVVCPSPQAQVTVLHTFTGGADGGRPYAALITVGEYASCPVWTCRHAFNPNGRPTGGRSATDYTRTVRTGSRTKDTDRVAAGRGVVTVDSGSRRARGSPADTDDHS